MDWVNFDCKKQAAVKAEFAVNIKVACTECGEAIPTDYINMPDDLVIRVVVPPCPTCFPKTHAKWKKRLDEQD